MGKGSTATAAGGVNNRTIVVGKNSSAKAIDGDDKFAVTIGDDSHSIAGYGSHNIARAKGNGSNANTTNGDYNTASVERHTGKAIAGCTQTQTPNPSVGCSSAFTGRNNNTSRATDNARAPGASFAGQDTFNVTVSDAGSGFHIHGIGGLLNMLSFGLLGSSGHKTTETVFIGFQHTVVASGLNSPVDSVFCRTAGSW